MSFEEQLVWFQNSTGKPRFCHCSRSWELSCGGAADFCECSRAVGSEASWHRPFGVFFGDLTLILSEGHLQTVNLPRSWPGSDYVQGVPMQTWWVSGCTCGRCLCHRPTSWSCWSTCSTVSTTCSDADCTRQCTAQLGRALRSIVQHGRKRCPAVHYLLLWILSVDRCSWVRWAHSCRAHVAWEGRHRSSTITIKRLLRLLRQGCHSRDGRRWQAWWCQQSRFYLLTRRDGSLCLNNKPSESLRKSFPLFLFCPGAPERDEDIDRGQIPVKPCHKVKVVACEASWELENSLKTEWSQLATAQPMQMDDGEEGLLNICAALSRFMKHFLGFEVAVYAEQMRFL